MDNNFYEKYKRQIIVAGGATMGMVVLIIISAIVNMPEDISGFDILANLIWFILIGAFCVGAVLYVREHYFNEGGYLGEEDLLLEDPRLVPELDQQVLHPPSIQAEPAERVVPVERSLIEDQIEKLFGTTDIKQITKSIEGVYGELSELRERDDQGAVRNSAEQQRLVTALTNERDQIMAQSEKWQAKAISSTQQIAKLRQELEERGEWEAADEEELETLFESVTIKDGSSQNAFLDSKRRQRRLTQRLSAEGYCIVRKPK